MRGQNVEADKLNSIILDSDKAYNNKNNFRKINNIRIKSLFISYVLCR